MDANNLTALEHAAVHSLVHGVRMLNVLRSAENQGDHPEVDTQKIAAAVARELSPFQMEDLMLLVAQYQAPKEAEPDEMAYLHPVLEEANSRITARVARLVNEYEESGIGDENDFLVAATEALTDAVEKMLQHELTEKELALVDEYAQGYLSMIW